MSQLTIACIADIHGNSWALDAVLQDIADRNIQQIVNLGDNLDGPLDLIGTAERLLARTMLNIRGNGDRALLEATKPTYAAMGSLLAPAHLKWLRTLPATAMRDDVFLCHGTPDSDENYLLEKVTASGAVFLQDVAGIEADVAHVAQPVILCGHTHIPRTILLPSGKLIVNPGSVGLPAYTDDLPQPHHAMETGSSHAKYAILTKTDGIWQVEHVFVPYDWEQAVECARDHQRDDWAHWLASGRVATHNGA